jgi:hypothetical protein
MACEPLFRYLKERVSRIRGEIHNQRSIGNVVRKVVLVVDMRNNIAVEVSSDYRLCNEGLKMALRK